MSKLIKILIIIIEGILFSLFHLANYNIPCFFKTIFHIPCPGCGLSRSFLSILRFDFAKAIYYNILGIPLAIFLITVNLTLIYDIVTSNNISEQLCKCLLKHYKIIIILLIITEFINIYHNI